MHPGYPVCFHNDDINKNHVQLIFKCCLKKLPLDEVREAIKTDRVVDFFKDNSQNKQNSMP